MRVSRPVRILGHAALFIVRRPWLFALAFALSDLLMYLSLAVLFTNHCPSSLRFVPELSDEFAAAVSDVYDFSLRSSVIIGAVMFTAPIIPLVFRRYRTVVIMLVLGVAVMKAGRSGLSLIPWGCRSALAEQMRIVRLNVARKAEAKRQGKSEWRRVPVLKFERKTWYFHNERYEIHQPDNTVDKSRYFLSDNRWRQSDWSKEIWRDRVLLDDIVSWGECGNCLHVETKSGKRYSLDYATGELRLQGGEQ